MNNQKSRSTTVRAATPVLMIRLLVGLAAAGAVACAHKPPPELVAARQTYGYVLNGPAPRVVPAEVHKARLALVEAEKAFHDERAPSEVATLAYVAERRALIAEAIADRKTAEEMARNAAERTEAVKDSTIAKTTADLEASKRQQESNEDALAREQSARLEAEQHAQQAEMLAERAITDLASLAEIKNDERGVVISLSGSVLFASNQSTLLPEAQKRLDQVADALRTQENKRFIVEGHTDSRGADGRNKELSFRRATAVADYLVSRGLDPEAVQARGVGEERPIADNNSPEGRANNRRVEIVIEKRVAANLVR